MTLFFFLFFYTQINTRELTSCCSTGASGKESKANQNKTSVGGKGRDLVWCLKIQEITVPFQSTFSPQKNILKTLEFNDDDEVEQCLLGTQRMPSSIICILPILPYLFLHKKNLCCRHCFTPHFTDAACEA